MSCLEFFESNKEGKKCKLLQGMPESTLIQWENESASKCSPGVVLNTEILYHQILDPTNLNDAKNTLLPVSFDTATGVGMSTNRLKHTTVEDLVLLGKSRADSFNKNFPENPKARSFWGFVPIPVDAVRALISNVTQTRGLFVYDTANPDDVSHADICQGTKDQRGIRAARLDLYDLVKGNAFQYIEPEEN